MRAPSTWLGEHQALGGFETHTALYQALKEFVDNSLDAIHRGAAEKAAKSLGRIDCKITEEKQENYPQSGGEALRRFKISVSDTGVGIKHSAIPHLVGGTVLACHEPILF